MSPAPGNRWGAGCESLRPRSLTYSLHCSSFLGLPFRILSIQLVKPKKELQWRLQVDEYRRIEAYLKLSQTTLGRVLCQPVYGIYLRPCTKKVGYWMAIEFRIMITLTREAKASYFPIKHRGSSLPDFPWQGTLETSLGRTGGIASRALGKGFWG